MERSPTRRDEAPNHTSEQKQLGDSVKEISGFARTDKGSENENAKTNFAIHMWPQFTSYSPEYREKANLSIRTQQQRVHI